RLLRPVPEAGLAGPPFFLVDDHDAAPHPRRPPPGGGAATVPAAGREHFARGGGPPRPEPRPPPPAAPITFLYAPPGDQRARAGRLADPGQRGVQGTRLPVVIHHRQLRPRSGSPGRPR